MATNLQANFDLTEAQNLFKTKFLSYAETVFNTATPLLSQIEKTNDFTGKRMEFPVPFGYQGGVGSGSLPESNVADYQNVQISSKKVYATCRVDREAIAASMSTEGAFVQGMKEAVEKTVEAFTWNISRILFGDGTGLLGTVSSVVDNGSGNYSLTMPTTWKEANFEERMFVNIETGNTDLFEIQSINTTTRVVVVQRQAGGTQVPAASDGVYLQGSENNDPEGLKGVLDATLSTKYGVNIGRRWQAYQITLSGSPGIVPDYLNQGMLQVEKRTGKVPNLIVTSFEQYEKLLNQMEDQKRYSLTTMSPKGKDLKGVISYDGIQFMSSRGAIKIFPDKFCEADRLYGLNTDFIKIYRRPKSGWFTDDGTTFLRVADEDAYEARYGMYGQIYIAPTYHFVITGLAT